MPGHIHLERDHTVATVILDNPTKLNAIDARMWEELGRIMTGLNRDDSLRCVLLRGAGDSAFAAGGDLEEFLTARATLEQAMHYHDRLVASALDAIRQCPVPTVAAILGPCIGGGLEIAGCCDLRIAGRSARFGAPINKLGFSMYPGEMAGLLDLVGPAVLLEILLEGRILEAEEAYAKGLLTRVLPDEEVLPSAQQTIRRILSGAPLVARWHKYWVHRLASGAPLSEAEKRASFAFLETQDYQEGLDAFFAKRSPDFKGR